MEIVSDWLLSVLADFVRNLHLIIDPQLELALQYLLLHGRLVRNQRLVIKLYYLQVLLINLISLIVI